MKIIYNEMTQMRNFFPFPELLAFTDVEAARKYARKRFDQDIEEIDSNGRCETFFGYEDDPVILVILTDEGDSNDRYAILAHECVHVAFCWIEKLGIENIDEELVAYGVQSAMLACVDQIGKEWFENNRQAPDGKKKGMLIKGQWVFEGDKVWNAVSGKKLTVMGFCQGYKGSVLCKDEEGNLFFVSTKNISLEEPDSYEKVAEFLKDVLDDSDGLIDTEWQLKFQKVHDHLTALIERGA